MWQNCIIFMSPVWLHAPAQNIAPGNKLYQHVHPFLSQHFDIITAPHDGTTHPFCRHSLEHYTACWDKRFDVLSKWLLLSEASSSWLGLCPQFEFCDGINLKSQCLSGLGICGFVVLAGNVFLMITMTIKLPSSAVERRWAMCSPGIHAVHLAVS